ncbi:MAG: choice-of-anchor D domain-containing protein [Alphaproteobacteria bacterium]|nr:MAG: choice-of-anchor D domain-containing protein [Alphaproteobacteria bacterium]
MKMSVFKACLSCVVLGLIGCTSSQVDPSHYSGFLKDYSRLEKAESASGAPDSLMKHLLLPIALLTSTLTPALAIADAEIAPAALAGKTVIFTINFGMPPFATTGTWSGTFAASGKTFTAKKITGDFVDVTTTFTTAADGLYTNVSLAKIVNGQSDGQITLYTDKGTGRWEGHISDLNGGNFNGTFVFGTAPSVKAPKINIQQPVGSNLTDNRGKKSFGTAKAGKKGSTKTFTIKNTGTEKLTKIAVSLSGKNSGDFSVTSPGKNSLAPGASTTFKATFKPKAKGTKNAVILIKSNDKENGTFDVKVTGLGAK